MSEELRNNKDLESEIRAVLGDKEVDALLANPAEWSIDAVFSEDRFTRIETQRHANSSAKMAIYNKRVAGEITKARASKDKAELKRKEEALEKDPDFPAWMAFNSLLTLQSILLEKD